MATERDPKAGRGAPGPVVIGLFFLAFGGVAYGLRTIILADVTADRQRAAAQGREPSGQAPAGSPPSVPPPSASPDASARSSTAGAAASAP